MRIYFFCRNPGPPEAAGYEHGLVALAEGLSSLGVEIAGNRNLWPTGAGWLIPETTESPEDYDVVLISNESCSDRGNLPAEYLSVKRPYRVYVDLADGWRTDASSRNDWPAELVLRSHYNQKFRYPLKVRPWAFGLTERMITATKYETAPADREPSILCNFRVGHPVRDALTTALRETVGSHFAWDTRIDTSPPEDPEARKLWALTGRRHNPTYFQRLIEAQGCLAFGGFFAPGLTGAPSSLWGRAGYRAVQQFGLTTSTLTQYDSWRFWESLAAGAATVHAPLAEWGVLLPEMPVDGLHYVSFRPGVTKSDFMARWTSCLESEAARRWAVDSYGPVPTASRFLELLP